MKTEFIGTFDKVFWSMRDNKEWGWDMAAIDALRDAILCAENDNIGGAWSYIREADGYLDCLKRGWPYAPTA